MAIPPPPQELKKIPYGRQWVDEDDIAAVAQVLRSDWLTTGPMVGAFEAGMAQFVGVREAVAVSSGTAALHAAMHAIGINPGDEVIVPPITFVATSNAVVYLGGTPVFADVDPGTLLLDPAAVAQKITPRTKAIISVDFAGQPGAYDVLRQFARRHGLVFIADACHALGAEDKGSKVGSLADLTVFSFHPVKHITTGEGGMITTEQPELAQRLRVFRNHGITTDSRQRETLETWRYDMVELGFNYRITDIQCALGLSQLQKLPVWIARRQDIARRYDQAFADLPGITPLRVRADVSHAYHLYVVRLDRERLGKDRGEIFRALRSRGIGVNVHYLPVYLHPYYRQRFGTGPGLCPMAEAAYEQILSLPMFPKMTDADVQTVIDAVSAVITA